MVTLGNRVKDSLTGFSGIAMARTEWLYGCARIAIEPQELKDAIPVEMQWFDEQRVVFLAEGMLEISEANSATSGGQQRDPSSRREGG